MAIKERVEKGETIKHDRELENSYGQHIPQPSTIKGDIVAFGELAGSTTAAKSLTPERTTFGDSIVDNRKNQPKSH